MVAGEGMGEDMSSHIAEFRASSSEQALLKHGIYTCGGNLFWCSFLNDAAKVTPVDFVLLEQYQASFQSDLESHIGSNFVQVIAVHGPK